MQIDRNGNINRYHYTIDGALSYQRAEDKKGRYPVVNRYMYYPDGRLKEAEGGGITYCYDYTENGHLKRKSTAKKLLLEYAYDQNGNLSVLTDGKGKSVYYSYDGLNRLQQVSEGEGKETILAEYSYNLAGQVEKMHYGNGLQTECRYRDDGNLTSLVTITAQGKVLLNFDYAYDGNGNCIQKSGERYQNTYVYGRMNRLVEAAYDGKQERYTYDLAGNRLKKESEQGTEIYHYNVKNQLTHVHNKEGEIKYHYDVQGNLLEEQGTYWKKQYTYDAANHQRSVAIENQTPDNGREHLFQQNQYDAEGLRYEVEENGKIHYFLFDRGELAEESQENSSIRYLRGYQPIALESSKEKEYFVQDEAGSTLFLLDKDHEIQKTYRYDAFGIILKEMGGDGELSNRLTYTGQMLDCATGQYYLRARFYHPEIGRFMQEDVYRGDGLNLYAYCANNPVMYYDPSGYVRICTNIKTNSGRKKKDNIQISSSGKPEDIMFNGASLNKRQKRLLDQLPGCSDSIIVHKNDVNLKDLAALTAYTGNEFAMFTQGSRRYIIRGNSISVPVDLTIAENLAQRGWRWSAHSHPGISRTVLAPSAADRLILKKFSNQTYSATVNSMGRYKKFSKD